VHRLLMGTLSDEERQILIGSQSVLTRQKEITFLFVEGLVGKNFSKALSFYLDRSREYLEALIKLQIKTPPTSKLFTHEIKIFQR